MPDIEVIEVAVPGIQGPAGEPVTEATSTTELTVGGGTKTLTVTPTTVAISVGQRVRIVNGDATRIMDGEVSAFDDETGALEVNADYVEGSGSDDDWTVIINAGPPGPASLFDGDASDIPTTEGGTFGGDDVETVLGALNTGKQDAVADPGQDRVLAWDDSLSEVVALPLADIAGEGSPAAGDYVLIYGAEGDLRKVDWDDLPAGGAGTPGGSDTHVQFNDDGDFGGDSRLVFDKTNGLTTVDNAQGRFYTLFAGTGTQPGLFARITGDSHARIQVGPDVSDAGAIRFGPGNATQNAAIVFEGTGILAHRSGATAQVRRLYRTFTDASNYERVALQSGSGYFELAAETAGSGTDNIDLRLTPAGTGQVTSGGAPVAVAGKQTIWVPASAMVPRTTNGAEATSREINGITLPLLAFDESADEGANFSVTFPKSWNAGTITVRAIWTCTGGASAETVEFEVRAGSFANDAAINATGFGTAIAVADTWIADDDVHVSAESGAITIANAAADVPTVFEIIRDVSDDNLSADAELIGVEIHFTTSAKNDA